MCRYMVRFCVIQLFVLAGCTSSVQSLKEKRSPQRTWDLRNQESAELRNFGDFRDEYDFNHPVLRRSPQNGRGPPNNRGPPKNRGPPANRGPPDNRGPPANRGPPPNRGPPSNRGPPGNREPDLGPNDYSDNANNNSRLNNNQQETNPQTNPGLRPPIQIGNDNNQNVVTQAPTSIGNYEDRFSEGKPYVPPEMMFQAVAVTPDA